MKTVEDEKLIGRWESQLRKGMLDFIILLCLKEEESYGYRMIRSIKEVSSLDISEGTIYPLLTRLKKDDLILSKWVELETGIPRKYYRITEKGERVLSGMIKSWKQFNSSLKILLARGEEQ